MAYKRKQRSFDELMSNPDTEWYYRVECEHEGDVAHEEMELLDSDAVTDIRSVSDPRGDTDYYATIYFKVTDYDKFEKFFECPVWEMASTYDMWYWVDDEKPVSEKWHRIGGSK